MPVTTRSASAEAKAKMHLRSGRILHGSVKKAKDQVSKKKQHKSNKLSAVEEAKNHVRQQVKERQHLKAQQRQFAERKLQNDINSVIFGLKMYLDDFNGISDEGCDPFMEKIRILTKMYSYVNSQPIPTIMHSRLKQLRAIMLKVCGVLPKPK